MKNKIVSFTSAAVLVFCLTGIYSVSFSQDQQVSTNYDQPTQSIHNRLYVDINGAYNLTMINSNISTGWDKVNEFTVIPSINATYMLNSNMGVGVGLKLGKYSSGFSVKGFSTQLEDSYVDRDGDSYYPIYEGVNLSEINSFSTVDIPLYYRFQLALGDGKIMAYANVGLMFSSISKMTYTLDGTLTRKGFYPEYNVTLNNYPEYNFDDLTYSPSTNRDIEAPGMGTSGFISIGIMYEVAKDILVKAGGSFALGFSDVRPSTNNEFNEFHSSTYLGKTSLNSAAFELGIAYRFLK